VPTPLYRPPSLTTATENDKGHRDGGGEASQPTSDVGSYSNSVGICRHRGMTGLNSYRVRFPGSLPSTILRRCGQRRRMIWGTGNKQRHRVLGNSSYFISFYFFYLHKYSVGTGLNGLVLAPLPSFLLPSSVAVVSDGG
jgi:hypothetical protein